MSSLPSSGSQHSGFLEDPLRAVAEMVDKIAGSIDFKRRVEELHALSDAELAALGVNRARISHHVFTELSRA